MRKLARLGVTAATVAGLVLTGGAAMASGGPGGGTSGGGGGTSGGPGPGGGGGGGGGGTGGGPGGGGGGGGVPGGGNKWPVSVYPLPTGTVISESGTQAEDFPLAGSTLDDQVAQLDPIYLTQLGCTAGGNAQNVTSTVRDYLCVDPVTGATDEVFFSLAGGTPTTGPTDLAAFLVPNGQLTIP